MDLPLEIVYMISQELSARAILINTCKTYRNLLKSISSETELIIMKILHNPDRFKTICDNAFQDILELDGMFMNNDLYNILPGVNEIGFKNPPDKKTKNLLARFNIKNVDHLQEIYEMLNNRKVHKTCRNSAEKTINILVLICKTI